MQDGLAARGVEGDVEEEALRADLQRLGGGGNQRDEQLRDLVLLQLGQVLLEDGELLEKDEHEHLELDVLAG
eukprot:CAMPEP_0118833316 /NCGR_PEP_ID=MMETSP1162-20130426/44073_1 /TAXON_ID=33656 /ORGANISM="Phaeocystis Sp, Strain CCMP2710" /LENGTH=71 /DNA_ID=CAMNT_0006764971 /DNA_START=30 /DNA_END=241 /DNA_ORIENTATION=-